MLIASRKSFYFEESLFRHSIPARKQLASTFTGTVSRVNVDSAVTLATRNALIDELAEGFDHRHDKE